MKWYKKVDLKALFGSSFNYEQITKSHAAMFGGAVPDGPPLPPPAYANPLPPPGIGPPVPASPSAPAPPFAPPPIKPMPTKEIKNK